jgi:uncharacterized protein (TIGR00369 family)
MTDGATPEAGPPSDGWALCPGQQGFSSVAGPYLERRQDGVVQRAFRVEARHLNPEGVVHGGALSCFADYVGYRAIGDLLTHQIKFATLTLTCNFLAAGRPDSLIVGQGIVTRRTRSIIFADGDLQDADRLLMRFSGVWKILGH